MRTQIIEKESLCLLSTQMPRPVSCNTAYNRGDSVCVFRHGKLRLQAEKLKYEQVYMSLPKSEEKMTTLKFEKAKCGQNVGY